MLRLRFTADHHHTHSPGFFNSFSEPGGQVAFPHPGLALDDHCSWPSTIKDSLSGCPKCFLSVFPTNQPWLPQMEKSGSTRTGKWLKGDSLLRIFVFQGNRLGRNPEWLTRFWKRQSFESRAQGRDGTKTACRRFVEQALVRSE